MPFLADAAASVRTSIEVKQTRESNEAKIKVHTGKRRRREVNEEIWYKQGTYDDDGQCAHGTCP